MLAHSFPEDCLTVPIPWYTKVAWRWLYLEFLDASVSCNRDEKISMQLANIRHIIVYHRDAERTHIMSRKTTQKPANNSTKKPPATWVNVSLDDSAEAGIEEHFSDTGQVAGYFLSLLQTGEQVFVKEDGNSGSYLAGYIAQHPDHPEIIVGLSGWASDPVDAVRALLYKWFVVLGEVWPEPKEKTTSRFR